MRIKEILNEAIPFRSNPQTDPRVNREVGDISHTYDDAKDYQAQHYQFRKYYMLQRVEAGFRTFFSKRNEMQRSVSRMDTVNSAVKQLQLKLNPLWSGSEQAPGSISIGWSWYFMESASTGISILYYQDRGMGSDDIIIAAKSKEALDGAVGVFRDAGVLPDPADVKMARQAKASGNSDVAAKKGIAVGKHVTMGGVLFKVAGFTSTGRVKLLRVEPTGDPSWDKILLSPKRINPKDVS